MLHLRWNLSSTEKEKKINQNDGIRDGQDIEGREKNQTSTWQFFCEPSCMFTTEPVGCCAVCCHGNNSCHLWSLQGATWTHSLDCDVRLWAWGNDDDDDDDEEESDGEDDDEHDGSDEDGDDGDDEEDSNGGDDDVENDSDGDDDHAHDNGDGDDDDEDE